jgi:hypothetical protein
MLEPYSFTFIELVLRAGRMREQARLLTGPIPDYEREDIAAVFSDLGAESETLGLIDSSDLIARAKSRFEDLGEKYIRTDLYHDLDTLLFSFEKGLRRQVFFRIPPDSRQYFQQAALFGPNVDVAFPSAADDIEHAGTCLALGQADASVFHSMRVLERGLKAIAGKLGVDFDRKNWANVIDQVEAAVTKKATAAGIDPKERKLYAEAAVHFRFVKDAWRNDVMHLGDPYDAGKALSILTHVRELMQALAKAGLVE